MKTRCGFGGRKKKIQENETSTCSFFQCYLFDCFHLQILLHGMLKGWKLPNPTKWPLGALRPIKNYLENTLDDWKESIRIFSQLTMEFVPTSLSRIWDTTKTVISYFRLFQAYLFLRYIQILTAPPKNRLRRLKMTRRHKNAVCRWRCPEGKLQIYKRLKWHWTIMIRNCIT